MTKMMIKSRIKWYTRNRLVIFLIALVFSGFSMGAMLSGMLSGSFGKLCQCGEEIIKSIRSSKNLLFFFSLIFSTTRVWVTLERTCLKRKVLSCFVACLSSTPELKSIIASCVRAIIPYSEKWRSLGEYLFMKEWYTSRFPVCLNFVKYSMSASNFSSSMIEIR